MHLDVVLLPAEMPERSRLEQIAVVIDVIRATTSIISACQHGARAVRPVGSPEEALMLAAQLPGAVLAGERGGTRIPGFAMGNSPREFTAPAVHGRDVILTTSNGTRTLRLVEAGRRVAIGAFINRAAVARWLVAQDRDALIVCSGYEGIFSLEDAVCAGSIAAQVGESGTAELGDGARACRVLWDEWRNDLFHLLCSTGWGRHIIALGLKADLALCAELDTTSVLPILENGRITAGPVRQA